MNGVVLTESFWTEIPKRNKGSRVIMEDIVESHGYIHGSKVLEELNVVGVLLSGSVLYKHVELDTVGSAKDWDGLILVETKADIVALVKRKKELCRALGIVHQEWPELAMPPESSALYNLVDAVRLVGWTQEGYKKGTKIFSIEHLERIFSEDHPSLINILSYKDVRGFERESYGKTGAIILNQATSVGSGLVVLHDADILESGDCGRHLVSKAMFGVTTDMMATGAWVYQDFARRGERLVRRLIRKFGRVHTARLDMPLISVFKAAGKFAPRFRQALEARVEQALGGELQSGRKACSCHARCFWSDLPSVEAVVAVWEENPENYPAPQMIHHEFESFEQNPPSPFSSNSSNGRCVTRSSRLPAFWKKSEHVSDEAAGASLVRQFYRHVQQPLCTSVSTGSIYYPLFEGRLLCELRVDLARGPDRTAEIKVLELEMRHAEECLRAYCGSASVRPDAPAPMIDRFFRGRLTGGAHFARLHAAGLRLEGAHLSAEELLSMPIVTNGVQCGTLGTVVGRAARLLAPERLCNSVSVCGLGDSHCGNILVGTRKGADNAYETLYIDYEVAGYHSPLLDMAKPFYNDVFFGVMYADIFTPDNALISEGVVTARLEGGVLYLALRPSGDALGARIAEIKRRFLFQPFRDFLSRRGLPGLGPAWPSVLAHALFCCALLTRGYHTRPDVFLANLALGTLISTFKTEDIFFQLARLANPPE